MYWILVLSVALFITTFYFHFMALKTLHRLNVKPGGRGESRFAVTVTTILFIHMVEISAYAIVYMLIDHTGFGEFKGQPVEGFRDYLYFSIVSYTTLGIGDIYPEGGLRLLSGLEALNGLLLIAWSASFTYFDMERLRRAGLSDG